MSQKRALAATVRMQAASHCATLGTLLGPLDAVGFVGLRSSSKEKIGRVYLTPLLQRTDLENVRRMARTGNATKGGLRFVRS